MVVALGVILAAVVVKAVAGAVVVVLVGCVVVGLGVVFAAVVVPVVAGAVVVPGSFSLAGADSLNNCHRVKIFLESKSFALGRSSGIRRSSTSSHCATPCHTPYA